MGLLRRLHRRLCGHSAAPNRWLGSPRKLAVESLETRKFMAADLHVGSVYYEDASGDEAQPDVIQVTFEGGAAGTQLTHLTIDADKDGKGLSDGDLFFDTAAGGRGSFGNSPLKIIAHDGFEVTRANVVDGGSQIEFTFQGLDAGEKLVFSIDVDEAQYVDAASGQIDTNALVEGGEWQRTKLIADFTAPHFYDATSKTLYWDAFDGNFAAAEQQTGSHLQLPDDHYSGTADSLIDRTAGAVDALKQTPLPIMLSGTVFEDFNGNNEQQAGDAGIAGVQLELQVFNGTTYVATGKTATTDSSGFYKFGDLAPGRYRIVEAQPAGYVSVGAKAGTVDGQTRGAVVTPDVLGEIELLGGDMSVHNDFAEFRPGRIAGRVHADLDGDCQLDPGEALLSGVTIQLRNAAGQVVATTTTNAQGEYEFTGLSAGTYGLFEVQPDGYLDGGETPGTLGGRILADDTLGNIPIVSGAQGEHYDFCEIPPSSLSGRVHVDLNDDCIQQPNEQGLAGVTVRLLNAQGQEIARTTTNAQGDYRFENLAPGVYAVREEQPSGYYDSGEEAGSAGGVVAQNDLISQITLGAGVQAVDYNFCELLPVSISGLVHVDNDGDCQLDPGEPMLAGVQIQLLDAQGQVVATTTTDANGRYAFDHLPPGVYGVREVQPTGYFDGGEEAGTAGGVVSANDLITQIPLTAGVNATGYNFCELLPVSIRGAVHSSTIGDCDHDPNAQPLAGVAIRLLDGNGTLVAATTTDSQGRYAFENLPPGMYQVQEVQPAGYFSGDTHSGSASGVVVDDLIKNIALGSGVNATGYDFCEVPPARLSGYVFQDGPAIPLLPGETLDFEAVRTGQLKPGDIRLAGVTLELRIGDTGRAVMGSEALPGYYPADKPVRVTTDADGHYVFDGLRAGDYAVFEIQPGDYTDGLDTPGTNSGIAINPSVPKAQIKALQESMSEAPPFHNDAIIRIGLFAGDDAVNYNFSEVRTVPVQVPRPPEELPPLRLYDLTAPPPAPPERPDLPPVYRFRPASQGKAWGEIRNSTWHLSVVNAGQPRENQVNAALVKLIGVADQQHLAAFKRGSVRGGKWQLLSDLDVKEQLVGREISFGIRGATPITGDFNGDGISEIGLFKNGQWFIDINGNGEWDDDDLWCKLGTSEDRPVTGDWDGDGKTDIGIYGPAWPNDPRAVASEPGLPDPNNVRRDQPKNVPPTADRAPHGVRSLKLTATGSVRADLIDHVFNFGQSVDHPLAGDWNGDGIATIGIFRDGEWRLDIDGDGRFTSGDVVRRFGQPGDLPVVGDWNGDGIDEIGVFRDGKFILDTNGNGQVDAGDQTVELGGPGDKPVVGDWNGDGRDEPGVYHDTVPVREAKR